MMKQVHHWHGQDGLFWASQKGYRLFVHALTVGGYARFIVLDWRRGYANPGSLVNSASRDNVSEAKAAAELVVERLTRCHRFSFRR